MSVTYFLQAAEMALKFTPDRAAKVVQIVAPRLVEIDRCNPVRGYYYYLNRNLNLIQTTKCRFQN